MATCIKAYCWPARKKLHRWFRGHWRSITLSTWTTGTSPWHRSSPKKESCSYQTRQTSSTQCPQRQTSTLFYVNSTKARRNHWEPRLVSGDTQSSTSSLRALHLNSWTLPGKNGPIFNGCFIYYDILWDGSSIFFWIPKRWKCFYGNWKDDAKALYEEEWWSLKHLDQTWFWFPLGINWVLLLNQKQTPQKTRTHFSPQVCW